jgi:DNA-binding Lrp family transcriptional regulator
MAKLVNLIPGREVVKEELDDMDVSLPSSVERFLDRAIRALKGYNLNKRKEQYVIAKLIDALGMTPSELMLAVQKLKKNKIVKREHVIKLKDLLKEASFLDNFKKVNSGYNPKKIIADFTKESGTDLTDKSTIDPEDKKDHERYVKDLKTWFDKMDKKGPTVKVGDLVSVSMKTIGKEGIGKIVKAVTMQGNFGYMGQAAPDKQPSWKIDCYSERNIGTSKQPIEYKGKSYYYQGTVYYPQHEEGDKNAFSKLK